MDAEGYLPITLIASFHRVQALSADVALVMSAVKSSDKLEVYKEFLIRTKNDPLKWPMPNVGADGVTVVPVVSVRPEIDHPQPTAFIPVILQAAPPPVSEVLHHIPPPPMIRNSRKNASDIKQQPQQIAAAIPVLVAAAPPPILPNSSVIVVDHLNPDVSAFVPKTSPKNEVANVAKPPAAKEHIISEATDTASAPTTTTEDANIWKEVKRRSKSSQQKEYTQPSSGSDMENNRDIVIVNNANNINNNNNVSTAVNSNSVSVPNKAISSTSTTENTKKSSLEKEELDFRFDEEMQFEEEIPHGGGRINNFSELSDDDYESDYELSDRDINKLLIVTQVKSRPPKHEGIIRFKLK